MDHKKLLNYCYDEQTKADVEMGAENTKDLQDHRDIEKFNKAEEKRKKIFRETSEDILELITLLNGLDKKENENNKSTGDISIPKREEASN